MPLLFLLLAFPTPSRAAGDYQAHVAAFHAYEAAENAVFEKLSFTPLPLKTQKGMTFKFSVVDQLGERWLFKGGKGSSDGAVAMYRFFTLFGLPTPEVHSVELSVNGRKVPGTLQRFVENAEDLHTDAGYLALGEKEWSYLAKNQLFSWLLANYHVKLNQFLVAPAALPGDSTLQRIDNSIEWYLLGKDRLAFDWVTPMLWNEQGTGYARFWRQYFHGSVRLHLDEEYRFVRYVAGFPEEEYAALLREGVRAGLDNFPNTPGLPPAKLFPDIVRGLKRERFLPLALSRKRALPADFRRFYGELAGLKGEKITFPSSAGDSGKAILERLGKGKARQEQRLAALRALPPAPTASIEIPLSFAAHGLLLNFHRVLGATPGQAAGAEAKNLLAKLEELEKTTSHPRELEGVRTVKALAARFVAACESPNRQECVTAIRNTQGGFLSNLKP